MLPPTPHPWHEPGQLGCSRHHSMEKGHPQHLEWCPAMPSEAGGHEDGGDKTPGDASTREAKPQTAGKHLSFPGVDGA